MSKEERNQKILELRLRNERKNIVKKLNQISPNLSLDSFLGLEQTKEIKELVYQYIDDNSSQQEKLSKGTVVTIDKLMSVKPVFDNFLNETAYLLFDKDRDIGAITTKLNDIYLNIESILDFTEFSKDFSDLIVVGRQFCFGLCIERQEYNNIFVYWTK
ncbi:hypothetical protein H1230_12385 [Paenibacillus sp. 19GGS1-52]|uniref:YxiF family protein n=1 Tax=Paenibacillus sp. 19GGS1-52 TaxID=2758563 RepID=UPI001EFA8862|nr:hypothetical protein [Paenibacillus sp. 19GGS1-52]ULO09497.1 hypothetical protein H1230_12385 [Paenibacillus sp. 19GGS1-52]